jgi:serine/threonine protein kinase
MDSDPAEATELHQDVDRDVVQAWLDALSTGACDEDGFLRAVQKLTRRSPDAGWDSLSLVDQYYRRGKIPTEVFNSLKSRLANQLVGPGMEGEVSSPRATRAPVSPEASTTPQKRPSPSTETRPIQVAATPPILPILPDMPVTQPSASARTADTTRRAVGREIVVGEVLRGRYVIKSVLGRGGSGVVFEAADLYRLDLPDAGQRVALKVLYTQVSGQSGLLTELQREFQLLQSLSHPNIVRVHDYDRDGDLAFFTMEYLRGLSLAGILSARNQTPLDRAHALAIIRDVGAALVHAHSRAVVHGDLNPGNIFITADGEVRVLDFGGADQAPSPGPTVSNSQSEQAPIATPRYASYQVLEGQRPDSRDDLYAFACIAYELLAGKHPFGEKTALEARGQRLKPSRPPGLTGKEWQALRLGLAFDREQRPSDVAKWLLAFDWRKAVARLPVLLALVRVSARPPSRLTLPLLGAAVMLLAVGLWAVSLNIDTVKHTISQLGTDVEQAVSTWSSPQPPAPADQSAPAAAASSAPPASHAAAPATSVQPSRSAQAPASSASIPRAHVETSRSAAAADASPPGAAPATSIPPTPATPAPAAHAPAAAPPTPEASSRARSRIEMASDTVEVPLTDPAARVVVHRKGSLRGEVTFSWWTESGTAKPGVDFMAVASHEESIADGKNAVSLFIPVVADSTRRQPKSFYVVINDPSVGTSLGARNLTMVTIPPSE